MTGLFDLLASIGDWLLMIGNFILSIFHDLVFLIEFTGKIIVSLPSYFAWVPTSLFGLVVLFPIVGIILLIAGRK